jgi:hypothetical protein
MPHAVLAHLEIIKRLKDRTFSVLICTYLSQETEESSVAVIEEGRALWVLGGTADGIHDVLTTQIVRPGRPTEWGPNMTEQVSGHCSTTLQDGSVIVTGGNRNNIRGSSNTDIFNFTTGQWSQKKDMKQRRMIHSCAQVWLDPGNPSFLSGAVTNRSVLSIVVAGGKPELSWKLYMVHILTGLYQNGVDHPVHSAEVYLPWNDTWVELPDLPSFRDPKTGTYKNISQTRILSLSNVVHLIGGIAIDWKTNSEKISNLVWRLKFNSVNQSFFWTNDVDQPMGIYL